MSAKIDIRPDHLEIVQNILRDGLPAHVKVWVFGSRAKWSAKDYSDLDLALETSDGEKIPCKIMRDLEYAFEESNLPWKVDLLDLNAITPEFRAIIEKDKVALPIKTGGGGMSSKNVQITEYGEISSNYFSNKLVDLCVDKIGVQTGPFGTQLHNKDYVVVGTPIITVEHLGDNRIAHLKNTPRVTNEDKARLSKYHLETGDIVFSRVGSVDRRAIVRKEEDGWLFSGRCLRVRVDKNKLDPLYLSYFFGLNSFKQYIRGIAVGATMPSINTKILSDLLIYYPSIGEQKKIGEIFSSLDDKIENNCKINEILEGMAQAVFKSWFVDFEPTRAKMAALEAGGSEQDATLAAMRAISGKSADELEQMRETSPDTYEELKSTATLFPSALIESDLGKIPDGWKVKPFSQLIELIGGGTPKRSEKTYWGGNIPWFSVKDAPASKAVFVIDTVEKITENGLKNSSTKLLNKGTSIISARGTVGKIALVGVDTAMNQSCYGVKGTGGIGPYMNYLNLSKAISTLKRNTHGAVFDTITKDTFETVFLVNPPNKLKTNFEKLVTPLFLKIKQGLFESQTLTQTRDALLPKLLSGEIDVSNIGDSS